MRHALLLPFFILFISITVYPQEKSNPIILTQIKNLQADKYLELNYYKPANFTKILAFGEDFGSSQDKSNGLSAFSFGMTFNYQGDKLTAAPESFILTFWAKSGKPKFAGNNSLKVISADNTLDLGDARYATKAREKEMEYLNFNVSRDDLSEIVRGNYTEMTIGNTRFKFTANHLKLFSNLLTVSDPLSKP